MKKAIPFLLSLLLAVPAAAEFLVNDCSSSYRYTATASQTAFSYPCEFEAAGDLVVLQDDAGDGVFATLVKDTDYTVTGASTTLGGTVTLTTGATVGDQVVIYQDMDVDRTSDFVSTITAPSLNLALDRLTLMVKKHEDWLTKRALMVPYDDVTGTTNVTVNLKGNAGKCQKAKADETGVEFGACASGSGESFDGGSFSTPGDDFQLIRGTTATRRTYTPSAGECAWDTDQEKLYCGDGTTAGGVDVSGYPYFDVTAYGATGDGVTDDNTAVQAAVTAVKAAGAGTLLFPDGTYLISDPIDLSANTGNHIGIRGIGDVTILKSTLTSPILLPGIGGTFENLTLRFSTRPGASDLRAVGIQLGGGVDRDEANALVHNAAFRDINIYQTFVGILSGPIVEAGESSSLKGETFANTYDNILIRDFYQSAIVLDIGPTGNDTGSQWSNINLKAKQWDSSTQINPAGSFMYFVNVMGATFSTITIDNAGDIDTPTSAPKPILTCSNTTTTSTQILNFDGMHIENSYFATDDQGVFAVTDNVALNIRGLHWNGNFVDPGSGNVVNLVRFEGDNNLVVIDGLMFQGNTATDGTFRQSATNGNTTGNSMYVRGFIESSADSGIMTLDTSGNAVSDSIPLLKQWNETVYFQNTAGQGLFAPRNFGTGYSGTQYDLDSDGVVTLVGNESAFKVDTRACATNADCDGTCVSLQCDTDFWDGISETPAPVDQQIIVVATNSSSRDVTARSGAGAISGADAINLDGNVPFVFASTSDRLVLQYSSATEQWQEIARRSGQATARTQLKNTSTLAVASNTIAPTGSRHLIDNSGGTATVSTITPPLGGAYDSGLFLYLSTSTTGNAVTIADYTSGSDNIYTGTDCTLDTDEDVWVGMLLPNSAAWVEIACQDNN